MRTFLDIINCPALYFSHLGQLPTNSAELWRGREEGWEQEGRREEVRRERRRKISAVRRAGTLRRDVSSRAF